MGLVFMRNSLWLRCVPKRLFGWIGVCVAQGASVLWPTLNVLKRETRVKAALRYRVLRVPKRGFKLISSFGNDCVGPQKHNRTGLRHAIHSDVGCIVQR
jgi:hypothetical protein